MEQDLRGEIVRVTRIVAEGGLARASDGNISVRLAADRFLVTPSGFYKMSLTPEDLLIIDWERRVVEGREGLRPSSEIGLHLEVYRRRPDVGAVLHAHPPYATAITIAGLPFPVDVIPELLLAVGDVPIAPYATPGTPELAASITELIRDHDALLLSHHGSLNVGRTLEEALIGLERVEHTARTFFLARALGAVEPLPPGEVERLRRIGRREPYVRPKDRTPLW